jgi:hypothetical protein
MLAGHAVHMRSARHLGVQWGHLIHRPHCHGDGPIGLNHLLPHRGQDDLAIRANEVVVAFHYVRAQDIHLHESLLDEVFHTLNSC